MEQSTSPLDQKPLQQAKNYAKRLADSGLLILEGFYRASAAKGWPSCHSLLFPYVLFFFAAFESTTTLLHQSLFSLKHTSIIAFPTSPYFPHFFLQANVQCPLPLHSVLWLGKISCRVLLRDPPKICLQCNEIKVQGSFFITKLKRC